MSIEKDVVWICDFGMDNCGATTLFLLYSEILGIKVLIRGKDLDTENLIHYKNDKELENLLDELSPKICLVTGEKDFTKASINRINKFHNLLFNYRKRANCKIVYLSVTRKQEKIKDEITLKYLDSLEGKFDEFWEISEQDKEFSNKLSNASKVIDLNLYRPANGEQLKNRPKTIGYPCRYSVFKGIKRLINAMELNLNNSSIPYIYCGLDFNENIFKEKGILNSTIFIVQDFAKSLSDKTPKNHFTIHTNFDDENIKHKQINIFPRWEYKEYLKAINLIGVAICPTLAKMKAANDKNQPFNIGSDKEDKYISKNFYKWRVALEYVNYEMIDKGVPVLFSKDYCLAYDPSMLDFFPEFIYNDLQEALKIAEDNYDLLQENAYKQREWLINKLDSIENTVRENLERLLNEGL